MLNDETAGIDCINCGFEEIVKTKDESDALKKSLRWTKNGEPICPACGHPITYEDYISE